MLFAFLLDNKYRIIWFGLVLFSSNFLVLKLPDFIPNEDYIIAAGTMKCFKLYDKSNEE